LDEIEIQVEHRNSGDVNGHDAQEDDDEECVPMQVFSPFTKPADDVSPENETHKVAERGLEHIAGAAPLGENGYPEKTHEKVDQLAERSQASPEEETGEHHDEGLEGQGNGGNRQTDEATDSAQGSKKRH